MYNENYKAFLKQSKENLNKLKDNPHSWIKVKFLSESNLGFFCLFVVGGGGFFLFFVFFCLYWQTVPKTHMERQKARNN